MKTLTDIATDFCRDRVAERDALRAMLPCTLDREANDDVEFYNPNPDWQRCGQAFTSVACMEGHTDKKLPQSRWCPNCLANMERVEVIKTARRRKGGLVRAMVAAYRRETQR